MKYNRCLFFRFLNFFVIILVMLSLTACLNYNPHKKASVSPDTKIDDQNAYDVLFDRYKELEYFYNTDQHDSLQAKMPAMLKDCRKYEQWKLYYISWELLGEDYLRNNDAKKAIDTAQEMEQDALERDIRFGQSEAYLVMGLAYSIQLNTIEAEECLKQAIDMFDPAIGDVSTLISMYHHYGNAMRENGRSDAEIDSMLANWKKDLDNYPLDAPDATTAEGDWFFKYYSALSDHLENQGRYQEALAMLDSAEYCYNFSEGFAVDAIHIYGSRGNLLYCMAEYPQALEWVDRAQQVIDSLRMNSVEVSPTMQIAVDEVRYKVLAGMERYHEALDVLVRLNNEKDAYSDQELRQQLNEMNKRFELNEIKKQNEQLQQRSRFTTGGVAMILGIVALLVFLVVNNRWRHRLGIKNRQLQRERNLVVAQNRQLAVERDRAEAASKAKTAFLQSMTHEIRTPLNAISGFTQVLAMPDVELHKEERADFSKNIQENTRLLTNILDDLILVSNMESGVELPDAETCQANDIMTNAMNTAHPLVADDVTLNCLCDPPTLVVTTYPGLIRLILNRLLDNAAKFTKEGHITLGCCQEGDKLHFAVSDTGPGIPTEKREYIFERFAKIDSFVQGAGLGLSIARMIAERLGGTLTLDSDYNEGAKFDLIIPINPA